VTAGPGDPLARLRRDYAAAFVGYLNRRDESGLRAAYELGRSAMSDPLGLLHLVQIHHEVLLELIGSARTSDEVQDTGRSAAAFLVEALASFQMTQRGYLEKVADAGEEPIKEGGGSTR
jgi:Phosphoserine phosphatase RsbU, N-terminal domain